MIWIIIGIIIIIAGFEIGFTSIVGFSDSFGPIILGAILIFVGIKKVKHKPPTPPTEKEKEEMAQQERKNIVKNALTRFQNQPFLLYVCSTLRTTGFPKSAVRVNKDKNIIYFEKLSVYTNKVVRKEKNNKTGCIDNTAEWLFEDGRINNIDLDSCKELAHWFGCMLFGDVSNWYVVPITETPRVSNQAIAWSMISDSYEFPDDRIVGYELIKKSIEQQNGAPFKNI